MAEDTLAMLDSSRSELMNAIEGLDEEGFRRRPQRGEWTAAEVLAHLLETERSLLNEITAALTEDQHTISPRTDW